MFNDCLSKLGSNTGVGVSGIRSLSLTPDLVDDHKQLVFVTQRLKGGCRLDYTFSVLRRV